MGAAALLGMGIASAVGSIFSSKIQADASKNAAATQVSASDKAIASNNAALQQQQANLAPYQQAGSQAAGLLGSLLIPQGQPGAYRLPTPPPPQGAAPQQPPPPNPNIPSGGAFPVPTLGSGLAPGSGSTMGRPAMGAPPPMGQPSGMTAGMPPPGAPTMPGQPPMGMSGQAPPMRPTGSAPMPSQPTGQPQGQPGGWGSLAPQAGAVAPGGGQQAPLVSVMGPDGKIVQVPQPIAQQLVQRGGKIVG